MAGIMERLKRLLGGGEPENAQHPGAHSHAHEHIHDDGAEHDHDREPGREDARTHEH